MTLLDKLETLRMQHHECEDCWYSCPKANEYCGPDAYECDCGADRHNDLLDNIIEQVKDML